MTRHTTHFEDLAAVPGLDAANAGLVADAVLHAAGSRDLRVGGAW